MRTHSQIIHAQSVADICAALDARGFPVSDPTVRSWTRRPDSEGSIPATYWNALVDAGLATLEELADHASQRGGPKRQSAA